MCLLSPHQVLMQTLFTLRKQGKSWYKTLFMLWKQGQSCYKPSLHCGNDRSVDTNPFYTMEFCLFPAFLSYKGVPWTPAIPCPVKVLSQKRKSLVFVLWCFPENRLHLVSWVCYYNMPFNYLFPAGSLGGWLFCTPGVRVSLAFSCVFLWRPVGSFKSSWWNE